LDTSRSRHVDDIVFATPEEALALIDRHVQELIAELERQVVPSPTVAG